MITAAAAVIVTLGLSAFSRVGQVSGDPTPVQFQYLQNTVSEAAFEDPDNWQLVGTEQPTCSGDDIVCVAETTQEELDGAQGSSPEEQFAQLLASQSDNPDPGATRYIESHTKIHKAEATE